MDIENIDKVGMVHDDLGYQDGINIIKEMEERGRGFMLASDTSADKGGIMVYDLGPSDLAEIIYQLITQFPEIKPHLALLSLQMAVQKRDQAQEEDEE